MKFRGLKNINDGGMLHYKQFLMYSFCATISTPSRVKGHNLKSLIVISNILMKSDKIGLGELLCYRILCVIFCCGNLISRAIRTEANSSQKVKLASGKTSASYVFIISK